MGDLFNYKAATEPFMKAAEDMQRRVDRASMYAVREAGRVAKKAGRAEAPVYKGPRSSVHIRQVKRARKAGVTLTGESLAHGGTVEGRNQIVVGLLRDSISTSRRLFHEGSTYSLRVGPRGPRVHLYAKKIERSAGYMRKALEAAMSAAGGIYARAWEKAMRS